jgi:hypothetical protein
MTDQHRPTGRTQSTVHRPPRRPGWVSVRLTVLGGVGAGALSVVAVVRSYVLNAVQQLPMLADECAGLAFPAQR